MQRRITIVGCGLGPDDLTERHRAAVESADVLAGGQRVLDWFPNVAADRVLIGRGAADAVDDLIRRGADEKVTVLASGDSLFFGIARLFLQSLTPDELEILPNISAAQAACARLGLEWSGADFFSLHGRQGTVPWRRILRAGTAVIYCDPARKPADVAAELVERYPQSTSCPAAVLEDLGGDREAIQQGSLADAAESEIGESPAMLVVMPSRAIADKKMVSPPLSLGLADNEYNREKNLITHPEVRAVVLAKLRLPTGVFWDIGAGSGSVGIEAAGLCSGSKVYCVEGNEDRVGHIKENVRLHGCNNVEVVEGDILEALPDLPEPQNVFVGGGGDSIAQIVRCSIDKLRPGGRLVAAGVLAKTQNELRNVYPDLRTETLEIAVRRSKSLGSSEMMTPDNPVMLFVFEKE